MFANKVGISIHAFSCSCRLIILNAFLLKTLRSTIFSPVDVFPPHVGGWGEVGCVSGAVGETQQQSSQNPQSELLEPETLLWSCSEAGNHPEINDGLFGLVRIQS